MVNRSRTMSQRGLVRVKKARILVMVLLIAVAVTIILIDKKETGEPEDVAPVSAANFNFSPATAPANENVVDVITASPSLTPEKPEVVAEIKKIEQPKKVDFISPIQESVVVASKAEKEVEPVVPSAVLPTFAKSKYASRSPKKQLRKAKVEKGYHVVRSGETLSTICQKHYGTSKLWIPLLKCNHSIIQSPKMLRAGHKLRLPSRSKLEKLLSDLKGRRHRSPHYRGRSSRHHFVSTSTGKAKLAKRKGRSGRYHLVAKGETLSQIAKKTGVSFLKLYDLNKSELHGNPDILRIGTRIWIPMASGR